MRLVTKLFTTATIFSTILCAVAFAHAQAIIPFDKTGKSKTDPAAAPPKSGRPIFGNPFAPRLPTPPPAETQPPTGGTPIRPLSTAPIPFSQTPTPGDNASRTAPSNDGKSPSTDQGKSTISKGANAKDASPAKTAFGAARPVPKPTFKPAIGTDSYFGALPTPADPRANLATFPGDSVALRIGDDGAFRVIDEPATKKPDETAKKMTAKDTVPLRLLIAPHSTKTLVVTNYAMYGDALKFSVAGVTYTLDPASNVVVPAPVSPYVFVATLTNSDRPTTLQLARDKTYAIHAELPKDPTPGLDHSPIVRGDRIFPGRVNVVLYSGLTPQAVADRETVYEVLNVQGDWLLVSHLESRLWMYRKDALKRLPVTPETEKAE